jgi:hypothetical protein
MGLLVVGGCGGGGGDGGDGGSPDPTSTAWFEYERDLQSPLREIFLGEVERSGDSLYFGGVEHVREGSEWVNQYPTPYAPEKLVRTFREDDAGVYEGTLQVYQYDVLVTTRAVTLTPHTMPTGTLSVSGTARGESVSGDGRPAHGRAMESGTSYQLLVYSALARDMVVLSFYFTQAPPLTPGPYEFPSSTLSTARVEVGYVQTNAQEIVLYLEDWSTTHVRGSFSAELETGEYVHGLFDVPIRPN